MQEKVSKSPSSQLVRRAGLPLIITWGFISLSFLIPLFDSTQAPYVSLTGVISDIAYVFAVSGGKYGAPVLALFMLFFLVSRDGMRWRERWVEALIISGIAVLLAGGGAAINEHVIKAELKIPRPNIVWLGQGNGLEWPGMTAEDFYETGDKEARRAPLLRALNQKPVPVALSERIKSHWLEETGYSFPSGHAFSAMFFSSFFLLMGAGCLSVKRLWGFYLLLPWALAVCYSRTLLRVHTPTDILVGSLQGLMVGVLAWAIARRLLRRFN